MSSPSDCETASDSGSSGVECDSECPIDSLKSLIKNDTVDTQNCPVSCVDTLDSKSRKSICCNPVTKIVWGVMLIIISLTGFIIRPLDIMLWEKLNMRPGLPPYEWWADPPDKVKMRAYVFNVTNYERFLQGLDAKMNMQEIGPIVYLEKLEHSNIRFNDNDTMTYTATRRLIYLPDENNIDMNSTIIVPNLAVLGMMSQLHDSNYFLRTAFKMMLSTHPKEPFLRKTIHEFLWEFRESILDTAHQYVPGMLPITNLGILSVIYYDFVDEVTVKIGPRWGHENFFKIDRLRGVPQMTGYNPETCPDRVTGATEGVMYHQYIKKEDVLLYLRKTVCKIMPLYFDKEVMLHGLPIYRFNLTENVFDRLSNTTDCYNTEVPLPSGISDTSKCFFNFPLLASYPHFYTGSPPKDTYVTGLTPDRSKHNSYLYVEPITGIPFISVARMQSNLRIHDLSSFNYPEYNKFSNMVLPLSWMEYNQEGLPNYIENTVYLTVIVLPPLSKVLLSFILLLACYILSRQLSSQKVKAIFGLCVRKRKSDTLSNNKKIVYESESFLKS